MRLEMNERPLHGLDTCSLNLGAADFWRHESERASERCSNPCILEHATQILSSEARRLVPVRNRNSLEGALEIAAAYEAQIQRRLIFAARTARRGTISKKEHQRLMKLAEKVGVQKATSKAGSVKKPDALQRLIIGILHERPKAKSLEVLKRLRGQERQGVIDDIDLKCIHFTDKGRCKTAPLSGLDDRVRNARKNLTPL
jgi:hypothetical protein